MGSGIMEVFGGTVITQKGAERDISLAIENDRIIDIGPTPAMRQTYSFSDSIGGKDMIVSPSFTDAHMHSFQVATKGLTSDKSLLDWLKKYIWKWEGSLTPETARACAFLSYIELLRSGVTTFMDYTSVHQTDEAFKAADSFGMRGNIGKTLMDRNSPPELQETGEEAIKDTARLIRKFHSSAKGRLRYVITPRFGITCTDGLLQEAIKLSKANDVMISTHAHENRGECAFDKKNYRTSAIKHFHKLGMLSHKLLLAHCIWLDKTELSLLEKTKTNVAHCPGSNMMLASGIADTPAMIRRGITVGLGSDVGAYYNLSMFDQMRLSVMAQKIRLLDTNALNHHDAFRLATQGGARALGLGRQSGMIAKGRKADLILLRTDNIAFTPFNDAIAQIVYCASPSFVDSVICDGRILMRGGEILVADEKELVEESKEILLASF